MTDGLISVGNTHGLGGGMTYVDTVSLATLLIAVGTRFAAQVNINRTAMNEGDQFHNKMLNIVAYKCGPSCPALSRDISSD